MKLVCDKLASGIRDGIFMWDEKGKKQVRSFSLGDEFLVDDQVGHEIIAKYKDVFKVVHYGTYPQVEKKMAEASPKNAAVKNVTQS
jgi:hypothetical protein